MTSSDNIFRELAADTFLERLQTKQFRSHNKHIIDYLPEHERRVLFSGLMEKTDVSKDVQIRDTGTKPLRFIETPNFDLLPFIVVDDEEVAEAREKWGDNGGSEGFASSLRDYFGVGVDDRVRLLVVFTPAGNETQKSAQDSAVDEHLLDLRLLCGRLAGTYGLDSDDQVTEIIETYLDYLPHEPWDTTLARLKTFLEAISNEPKREEWGQHLSKLGCFLADGSPVYAKGKLPFSLPRSAKEKRVGKNTRLQSNAALKAYLGETFDSPLVETDQQIQSDFDEKSAEEILSKGIDRLSSVDVGKLQRKENNKRKNKFDWDTVSVEGAVHFHKVAGKKSSHILLVAAPGDFQIDVQLGNPFDGDQEHVHLFKWNAKRSGPRPVKSAAKFEDDSNDVRFSLSPDADFAVYRAAVTGGSRSYKSYRSDFLIAVYKTDHPVVAWENGLELSLEHQAWVREAAQNASFKESVAGGDIQQRTISYASTELREEQDEGPESVELDALVDSIRWGVLHEGKVPVRICWVEDVAVETEATYDLLELAPYEQSNKYAKQLIAAFRKNPEQSYLGALTDVTRDPSGFWNVEISGSVRLRVRAWNEHGQEDAVASLLAHPDARIVERSPEGELTVTDFPEVFSQAHHDYLNLRERVFAKLRKTTPSWTGSDDDVLEAVQLLLTDLASSRELIHDYYNAWLDAVANTCPDQTKYNAVHKALLQTDLLLNKGESGNIERLTVLPTHPWLLRAMLSFQWYYSHALEQASKGDKLDDIVTELEMSQLIPQRIVEDWFYGSPSERFRAEDATPFHLDFLPAKSFRQSANLDYVARVVRNKIKRYLEMHRHLQDARRTLRIGFVNPGDGKPLFDGIRRWLDSSRPRSLEEHEAWLSETPNIEVILFEEAKGLAQTTGVAFDKFFREHLDSAGEKVLDQAMLSKLRYGKRDASFPESEEDYVHICFASGLIDADGYSALEGAVDEGWDGCFAGGLMPTSLRRTVTDHSGTNNVSERGLWVSPLENDAQRGGLARLLMLLKGAKGGMVDPGRALYWQVNLPTLDELEPMYKNSDWVVHLDRELGLELFRGFGDDGPKIIEYSDQEDPHSPGFDIITLTRHADPYLEQLGSVLHYADLEAKADAGPEAKEAANKLLDDINILSGSWALDFLVGNIAQERYVNRLKGNVGSALVFRWLRRIEETALKTEYGDNVVPVYVSLEELVRATPAANLPIKDGLVQRYSNENDDSKASKWCDDLLVLYLTPAERGKPYKIFGRIIEVKFGRTAEQRKDGGVAQVRGTYDLLERHLAGGNDTLEAPFRHRQLSLLIKSQLEQAVSSGILSEARRDALNLPALSACLASGKYEVDYIVSEGSKHRKGDVFLLSTREKAEQSLTDEQAYVESHDGVRVITLHRKLLQWLAFTKELAPTLHGDVDHTLPGIGRIGDSLSDILERGVVSQPSTGLGEEPSEAGISIDVSPSTKAEPTDETQDESSLASDSQLDDLAADGGEQIDHDSGPVTNVEQPVRDPGPMNGIKLLCNWTTEYQRTAIPQFLERIKQGEMSWEHYRDQMTAWTGSDKAPGGKNWSRTRILDFFEHYGFVEEDGEFVFRAEKVGAVDTADTETPELDDVEDEPSKETDGEGEEVPVSTGRSAPTMPLDVAKDKPLKIVDPDTARLRVIIERLRKVFEGHGIEMEAPPSIEEVEFGPRLIRVYARLMANQTINSVRKRSEDIARMIGTSTADIHIMNVTARRSIALDLPIPGMGYQVTFDDLRRHPSFDAAGYELDLGFCAGVHITGNPHWVDLAAMPHALVAGTTGSGKTVFLRSVILELVLTHTPDELDLRLSSSKPMDFKIFTQLPHASRREMAENPNETLQLVRELVTEMDRRIELLSEAFCDNLGQYNDDPAVDEKLPRIVAVIDEYAETVLSFDDKADRRAFEDAVGRLAQKARAAGIHLILCMQRPDSSVIQGAVKSNILHRFALKLPQNHDSRVILDEPGAEALLGKGDMLYKDAASKVHRLQVPYMDARTLKRVVKQLCE